MKNKLLIKVYDVSLSLEFDIYIPVNESIKMVIELIVKTISELSDNRLKEDVKYCLFDSETNTLYNYASIVRDTNINNGKKLFLV